MIKMPKPTIEIDGSRFDSLSGFWDEISTRLIPGAAWGRNLDAFDDILRSGFGTPKGGFRLRWVNFERSREILGYPETIRSLERKLQECDPENVNFVKEALESARRSEGPTLADTIITIIKIHGPGGDEADDGIELELA
jgi:RNAse (barnase) inhibitor barstar